jgi:hypothetical protein
MVALIMGVIAFYWFGGGQLRVVIGAAMIINSWSQLCRGSSSRSARALDSIRRSPPACSSP